MCSVTEELEVHSGQLALLLYPRFLSGTNHVPLSYQELQYPLTPYILTSLSRKEQTC